MTVEILMLLVYNKYRILKDTVNLDRPYPEEDNITALQARVEKIIRNKNYNNIKPGYKVNGKDNLK